MEEKAWFGGQKAQLLIPFAIYEGLGQAERMIQPLALVLYEKLLPGSQLVNRLQDLKYRVQTLSDPAQLTSTAIEAKPMLVFVDLEPTGKDILGAIKQLKSEPQTSHIPVVGFMLQSNQLLEDAA